MTTNDRGRRTAQLRAAATARTVESTARARRAITKLDATGRPITFVSVARTAGVSTSFLYQQPDLRRDITAHRTKLAGLSRAPMANAATIASLRTKLAVAVQRNKDLTEEAALLRAENQTLRSSLLEIRRGATSSHRPG